MLWDHELQFGFKVVNAGAVVVVGFLRLWGFLFGIIELIRHHGIVVGSQIDLALAHYFLFLCLGSFDDYP